MTNDIERGKEYIDKAIQTENNDNAYSYRNLALYFQKKGDFESAENKFHKAFDLNTPVDLLDFYYGLFLIEKGNKKKGLEHIQISADIGEEEGIKFLEQMSSN
jgi:Tfp pilus assembly protein PilF